MEGKRKKLNKLSLSCLFLALAIFAFSYFLYHYVTKGFLLSPVKLLKAEKPMVTLLFSILGTCFLFASIISAMIASIFYSDKNE